RPGPVHAQDGGDPLGARQADVPSPGPDRPRPAARPCGRGALRPAGRRLSAARPGGRLARRPPAATPPMSPPDGPGAPRAGLSHSYGKTRALDDIALARPAGGFVGLIGPDGVGKSTLLGLLAGAKRIQSGRVEVLGGDMASRAHRAAVCPRIAFMPQGL